jgi:hypothetical protein
MLSKKRLLLFALLGLGLLLLSGCYRDSIEFAGGSACYEVSADGQLSIPLDVNLSVGALFLPDQFNAFFGRVNFPLPPREINISFNSNLLPYGEITYTSFGNTNFSNGLAALELGGVGVLSFDRITFRPNTLPPCGRTLPTPNLIGFLLSLLPTPRPVDTSVPPCEAGAGLIDAVYRARSAIVANQDTGEGRLITDLASVNLDRARQGNAAFSNAVGTEIIEGDSCGLEQVARGNAGALTALTNDMAQTCRAAQGVNPNNPITLALCQMFRAGEDLTNELQREPSVAAQVTSRYDPNLCFNPQANINCDEGNSDWNYNFNWYLGNALQSGTCAGFPDQYGGVAACVAALPQLGTGPSAPPPDLPPL